MPDDQHPQVFSLSEAAVRLHVSVKTVRRYIAAGRLKGYRLGPTLLRVDAESVDQLLEQVPTAVQRAAPLPGRPVAAHRLADFRQRLLLEADHIWPANAFVLSLEEHRKLKATT